MRRIQVKIPAGGFEEIAAVGDYVRLQSASVALRVEVGDGRADVLIEEGDAVTLRKFGRLRLSHSSASEQTFILLIGEGSRLDSSKVGGAVQLSPGVAMVHSAPVIMGTSTLALAANPNRRFLFLQNNDLAATVCFNLAGAAAVLYQGVNLQPGASIMLDVAVPTAAIYAIASTPTAALAIIEG